MGRLLDAGPDLARPDARRSDASTQPGWLVSIGGTGQDGIWNTVVDSAGEIVVSGLFSGTVSFGATTLTSWSETSSFVGKLDKTGKWLWAVVVDGIPTSRNYDFDGLAVDAKGNIFYTGQFEGSARFGSTTLTSKGAEDIFVAKLDPQGQVLWAVPAGGTGSDFGNALALGSDGGITIGGRFSGTASFGATDLVAKGASDLYVARLDAAGSFVWAVWAGSDSATFLETAHAVILDGSGNTFVTGSAATGARFGSLTLATAGTGASATYVAKLDPTGKFLWVSAPAMSNNGVSLALDATGNIYLLSNLGLVTGRSGPLDAVFALVSKVSSDGTFAWSTVLAGSGTCWGSRLLADGQGNTTVAGHFRGSVLLGSTVLTAKSTDVTPFLARLDSTGKPAGGEQISTSGLGAAVSLGRDQRGNLYVSGQLSGTAVFGKTSLTSKGSYDGFLWNMGRGPE